MVVDALGKSLILSVLLAHSENSTDLIRIGNALDLFKSNASYMTDGGTAYPVVAAETGMNHIECFHHFHNDLDKGKLGISAKERSELKNFCNKLLRVCFQNVNLTLKITVFKLAVNQPSL